MSEQTFCPEEIGKNMTIADIAKQADVPLKQLQEAIGVFFVGRANHYLVNTQKDSGEDIFNENIEPTLENSTLRFLVCTSSGTPSLDVMVTTDEAENLSLGVLSDANLTVGRAETFDVPAKKGWEYNLRANANTTWKLILVQELSP